MTEQINDLEIYPVNINGRMNCMYAVRDVLKNPTSYGDLLFDTVAEATEEIEYIKRERQQDQEYEAIRAKEREKEQAIADAYLADTVNGFVVNLKPMQKGRIKKHLEKVYIFKAGTMSIRQMVEFWHKNNKLSDDSFEIVSETKIKELSRLQYFRLDQRAQEAHEKRVREGGFVSIYFVNNTNIGKIGFDYSHYLFENKVVI